MILHNFEEMRAALPQGESRRTVAVACAHDRTTLEAILQCESLGALRTILVGDPEKIGVLLEALGKSPSDYIIRAAADDAGAAQKAVAAVRTGEADFLLKGKLDTSVLLKAVVNRETGLYTGRLMSHLAFLELPNYHKLIVLTDSGMILQPDLAQLKGILKNAVNALGQMGYICPKAGILAAVEKVNPKMSATLMAQELCACREKGEINGCILEGPVSYDILMSKTIAEKKGFVSEVAGDADIMLVTDMTTGNILGKALTVSAGAKMAGIISGAAAPIALTSRGSSQAEKVNSILLAAACCERRVG